MRGDIIYMTQAKYLQKKSYLRRLVVIFEETSMMGI